MILFFLKTNELSRRRWHLLSTSQNLTHLGAHFHNPFLFNRVMPEVRVPPLLELLEAVDDKFIELFGSIPSIRVVAPGRVNLIGEHTDYNGGYVLPMVRTRRA